jgi:hypothetical protein
MMKFWLAVVATVVQALIGALSDGGVSGLEAILIGIAFVNAVIVVVVPNLSEGAAKYAKGITAGVMAALTLASTLFADGALSSQDWLQIGVAVLAALGILGVGAPQWQVTGVARVARPYESPASGGTVG